MSNREQRVRMLAYRIWESEGRPEGQGERHWAMAERIVEAENAREEEQEWEPAHDESPIFEGEELPLEADEQGIDEQRLPLDDPETEALKEEDTGVEVHPAEPPAKPAPRKRSAKKPATKPAADADAAAKPKTPRSRKPRKPGDGA
ncbi:MULTISPECIES: DUF2934 domain-containing protein [Salinicola]|uniref:DUF2934 domain-containing protein n=1 Tax=Salinicola TaxID=404432 RepID=UPI000DA13B0E|nr:MULTISPECIES: DUF2934 domain-containing protein [Salinicola]